MNTTLQWPALQLDQKPSGSIEYERAVWGKVHGAPTDFRWIAKSASFGIGRQDAARQLNLGTEDIPSHFQAWRNLGDRCHAVTVYPSRAVDAAGRRGFIEKQVLEWHRPPHVPAVLGALLLLPAVAKLTDEIWWALDVPADTVSHRSIDGADHPPLPIDEHTLADAIERGRQTLRETVSQRTLELLYDQLLAGHRPAFLCGLLQPLAAEALAALLLPLPREIADRISIAGWIPTKRPDFADLGSRWDIAVAPPEQSARRAPSTEQAMEMAEELLAAEPAPFRRYVDRVERPVAPLLTTVVASVPAGEKSDRLWPGLVLDLRRPADTNDVLLELWEFARTANRRWLDPRSLAGLRLPKPAEAAVVCDWVSDVRQQRPGYAHKEQWNVKVDLLRSAALVLVPDPSTWQRVGPPDSNRVPILLFALMMESASQWNRLNGLGTKTLTEALTQSANCEASYWTRQLRDRLRRWGDIRSDLRDSIDRAFNSGNR